MIAISRSGREDAKAILDLQKLAYQSEAQRYNDFTIPPLVQSLENLEAEYQTHVIIKVVMDGVIIGSVRAYDEKGTCHIGRLIVHPACQNKGIGRQLMDRIEKAFPDALRFELFTGLESGKNLSFYQKLGYHIFRYEKLNDAVEFAYLEKSRKS
jgi:ribosomal protein S18 acetylase RimI-like enzyme